MTAAAPSPTFSISIEWENARFADLDRTRRMLRRLKGEIAAVPPPSSPPVVTFLFDKTTIDEALVRRVVAEEFRPDSAAARTRIRPTDGLRYYEQKNLGAAETDGEIVIFLDCDVIPDQGWLAVMLDAFTDPSVGAVGGDTYVDPIGLVSKAFALFWFFDLRDGPEGLTPAASFHANNVAFRRSIFAAHPFPDLPAYRAQCVRLGEELASLGVGLFRHRGARASHPCPRTVGYFIARALHNGRDDAIVAMAKGQPLRVWTDYVARIGYAGRQTRRRREVCLSLFGAALALGVAFAYFSLQAIGGAVSVRRPGLLPLICPV